MLATATITYDLSDYGLADFDSRRTKVWATNNVSGPVVDTEGNLIHLGSANGTVNADGTGSITVPTPGTGSNPASWQTTIHVDYPDRNADRGRDSKHFGPFTITVSINLADLIEEQAVPPEYAGAIVAEMEALRDETAAISGLTGEDAAVALLIDTPASDTASALSATIATEVPAVVDLRDIARGPDTLPVRRLYGPYLSKWDSALSAVRAGTRDAKILCIGDSTTAGVGGGTEATWTQQRSYPHYLAELLDERFIPAANGLQIPRATSGGSPSDTRWTAGSGWTKSDGNDATFGFIGFGGKGCNFQAPFNAAGTLTFNDPRITADTFDVYYMTTTGTGATFTAQATGGAASAATATGGLAAKGIAKITVSAGSALTTNTVTITAGGAAGWVYIVGIEPYLSSTKKVRVGNAGASGSSSVTWTAFSSGSSANTWNSIDAIKAYAPDLTIIDLGINDADPTNLTADGTYNTNIQTLINAAQVSGDVIIKTFIPVAGRETKQTALATLLDGRPVGIIDVYEAWGSAAQADAAGLINADNIHGNQAGYEVVAGHVYAALLGRTPQPGSGAQSFFVNGLNATDRQLIFSTNGVARWQLRVNSTTESGSNAGSDLVLIPRSDAGSQLTPVFTVTRSTSDITLGDGVDIDVGGTTGTKIGAASNRKLGFYGATPIVRPAANPDTSGATLAALETEVNELKAMLRSLGLLG